MRSGAGTALSADRPFPGLRPFGPLDKDFFFGRSAQYYALYRLLNLSRFLAVIGNSGSGKSSLVKAGLLPLLDEEGEQEAGRRWEWIEMRPGGAPLKALIDALSTLGDRFSTDDEPSIKAIRDARIERHLRGSSHGVAKAVGEMDAVGRRSVVILVDQFEELFRFAAAPAGTSRQDASRLRDEAAHFVQLILEACRSTGPDIHVIITLRSDFIGDCARYQGLPEAVSGTQFLVPSLTRDQREEVIRKPFEKAGAKIDSALVEQLLNDSGDESDQLPVLQHCLLRLWEHAGKRQPGESDPGAPSRHVVPEDYKTIGGMSGALSQHADEILRTDLRGLDPLVGRVFRALSDLDREGRATRRALFFGPLARETAIDEPVLRTIVDRFRADDCSFLTPRIFETPTLSQSTRIDVGHEALLRRWERVSGQPGATGQRGDTRDIGWLAEEHADGQRYQALRAMAVGGEEPDEEGPGQEGSGELLSSDQATRYWRWWNRQPRTSEWAERYGGDHDRVERLLKASWAARNRSRFVIGALAAAALALVVGLGAFAVQYRQAQIRADVAAQTSELAVTTIQGALDAVRRAQDHGNISVGAERDLLVAIAKPTLSIESDAPEVLDLSVNIQIAVADALSGVGETSEALNRARTALRLAERLVAIDPSRKDWRRLVFASAFRVGDAMLTARAADAEKEEAVRHYQTAQIYAAALAVEEPDRADRHYDLAFAHNKIGEGRQIQNRYPESLEEFHTALESAGRAVAIDGENPRYQSYLAVTHVKIGNTLQWQSPPDFDGALAQYLTAVDLLSALHAKVPDNAVVTSNLASARRGRGDILIKRWEAAGSKPGADFEAAIDEFTNAIALVSALRDADPTNTSWLVFLGPSYSRLGGAFEKAGRLEEALAAYESEVVVRRQLAQTDPTNERWQDNLESAQERVARVRAAMAAQTPPEETPPVDDSDESSPPQ